MINVIIADDHPLIVEGLKNILCQEADINVCCKAENAAEILVCLGRHLHDVLVTDITMPGKSGLELLKELQLLYPKLPVLILSMHPEDRFAVRAMKAGASGYLTKETAPRELVTAIRKVVNGGRYITAGVAESLAVEVNIVREKPPHTYLSEREYQLLLKIASGKSIQTIAEDLNLSINTAKSYRARLLDKLNLKTNVELTQYAMRNKLVE